MVSAVRGFVLRAFVEKLAFLQKARRKGRGGEDFSRGDGLQTRQPRRFCPVVDERRNGGRRVWVWGANGMKKLAGDEAGNRAT